MADPVWGQLAKAQDNPQTIEEAINAAIAAHEADPEAHIGTGESLETHRANGIIDHPAGSVLADKRTLTEWVMDTVFESLDAWNIVGSVGVGDLSGVAVYVEYGAVDTSKIYSQPQFVPNFFNKDYDMMYQLFGRWSGSNEHLDAWFGFLTDSDSGENGFGFQYRDGALYAHVRCGTTTSDQALAGVSISDPHIYRAQYSAADDEVTFFLDGSVVATIARPTGSTWEDDTGPQIGLEVSEANDGTFYGANLVVSRSI